jgi:manganese oxidase
MRYSKSAGLSLPMNLMKKIDAERGDVPRSRFTYFNCGRVSENEDNGQTIREFTLIVDENKTIPISGQGHILNGWTYNGTVPGPTMRMTEGDLVRSSL